MPPKKKAATGYKYAEPLPKGTILEDIAKNRWRLGPSIGKGGFGEIYSAQEEASKGSKYPYVVKIEPHSNGPLFVEINFYIRHAKPVDIEQFKKQRGLKTFGMPVYYGSGSYDFKTEKYRFLVMDKFSADLNKLFIDNNKVFPVDTVFKIGLQLVDILEYIHLREYVHADIKAANVLLGATKDTENKQVYLVDFGLATKFSIAKEFNPNPKKAHDGTIEFLSRDAHQGVQTRRGDLEILAYNLIQWLGCKLPWQSNLSDPKSVQKSKEDNMTTVTKMIKACFGSKPHPKAINEYLTYLKTLEFNSDPNYDKIRKIFTSGIKEGGGTVNTPFQFKQTKAPLKIGGRKKQPVTADSGDDVEGPKEDTNGVPRKKVKQRLAEAFNNIATTRGSRYPSTKSEDEETTGYNDEMKAVTRLKNRPKKGKQHHPEPAATDSNDDMAGYTAEMKAVARSRQARIANGVATKRAKKHADSDGEESKAITGSKKAKTSNVVIATTSKASNTRGLVKPGSRRLREKPPLTHLDVVSDTDSE